MDVALHTEDQSEFNQSISCLMRIDSLLRKLHDIALTEEYEEQYKILNRLFVETLPYITKKEEIEHQVKIKEDTRTKFKQYLDVKDKGRGSYPRSSITSLDEWEMEMRKIMQKKGLLLLKKTDARWSL